MESFADLGDPGEQALYATGKKYGTEIMNNYQVNEFHNYQNQQHRYSI